MQLALTKAGSPSARVVLGLALLGHSLTSSSSHLPGMVMGDELTIPLKQQPLADYFGLSRRLVSTSFKTLSDSGWLRLGYGSVELLKHEVWAELYQRHQSHSHGLHDKPMAELLGVMQLIQAHPRRLI